MSNQQEAIIEEFLDLRLDCFFLLFFLLVLALLDFYSAVEVFPFVGQVAFAGGRRVWLVLFQCLLVDTGERGKKTFGEGACKRRDGGGE